MIEINLTEKKEPFKLPFILGLDLNIVRWKLVGICSLVYFSPGLFLENLWNQELESVAIKNKSLEKQVIEIKKTSKGNDKIRKQLELFNKQIVKLKRRQVQVEKIVTARTNPKKLLQKIAQELPNDVWIEEITMTKDRGIIIKGGSSSYRSIGTFLISANQTSYFGKSLQLEDSSTIEETVNGIKQRIESFKIKGTIATFDPFTL